MNKFYKIKNFLKYNTKYIVIKMGGRGSSKRIRLTEMAWRKFCRNKKRAL